MNVHEQGQRPTRSVRAAVQIYQLLLHGYPSLFRAEYGRDMTQVFRDCYLAEKARADSWWLLGFWLRTLLDLLKTAPREHLDNLGKENSAMKNLGRDTAALAGCIAIIVFAALLLSYGRRHEASTILMFGYALDAIVFTGVVGNLIVFLLVKVTRWNAVRVALWTFLIVNALPAIVLAFVGGRIDPNFRMMATLAGYAVSFLFWFGIHWAWAQTRGRMQPAS